VNALVLGAQGQLGSELVRLLGPDAAVTHDEVSITDGAAVETLIARRKPDVVFNCAAYNAVDRAESEREAAFAVNAEGPRNVAFACRRHGAAMVHFSTNFVFDGALAEPYLETDVPSPLSVYGSSKLAGERAVQEAGAHVLIVRTAAVFGGRLGHSFPERILERARRGEPVRVVSDQSVNPTFAKDLAAASLELAQQGFAGIVHAVSDGCSGWDDFARTVLTESGFDVAVESVSTAAYPTAARRPQNGCLASIRYRRLRPWEQAVAEWART
jgi:dTDP-4-dehydrorhamnose reductase